MKMYKLAVFFAFIVCLASSSAERSERDVERLRNDKLRFRRCVIENCPNEYSSFRELELTEKEKCYVKCNPSNINTKDKSIKKSERAAIRECLDESNCFDLGIKHFENESQFEAFKTCADLKCSAIEPKQKKPKMKKEKELSTDSFWGAVRERKPMLYQDNNGGRIIYVGSSVDTRGMHLGHNGELVIPSPGQQAIDPNDWRWRFVWDPKTSIQKYVYDPTMTYEDLLRMVR